MESFYTMDKKQKHRVPENEHWYIWIWHFHLSFAMYTSYIPLWQGTGRNGKRDRDDWSGWGGGARTHRYQAIVPFIATFWTAVRPMMKEYLSVEVCLVTSVWWANYPLYIINVYVFGMQALIQVQPLTPPPQSPRPTTLLALEHNLLLEEDPHQ